MTDERIAHLEISVAVLEAEMRDVRLFMANQQAIEAHRRQRVELMEEAQKSPPDDKAPDAPLGTEPKPSPRIKQQAEREHHGRLLYELLRQGLEPGASAYAWNERDEQSHERFIAIAERFLTQVRPAPDYGALRDQIVAWRLPDLKNSHVTGDESRFCAGRISMANQVLHWLDEQEAGHE